MDHFAKEADFHEKLKPIENKVLNNYFWSFHHSQGNPTQQTLVSIYTARQYDKGEIGDVDLFEKRLQPVVERMQPPQQHLREIDDGELMGERLKTVFTEKDFQENEAGFQIQWMRLMLIFKRVFEDKPDVRNMDWMGGFDGNVYDANRLPEKVLLYQIANHMLDSDLKYQEWERPNRKGDSDPHSSHLQMYIYGGVPAQSPEYEHLYSDIRKFLAHQGIINDPEITEDRVPEAGEISLQNKFGDLVKKWETNHPNKKFIPDPQRPQV